MGPLAEHGGGQAPWGFGAGAGTALQTQDLESSCKTGRGYGSLEGRVGLPGGGGGSFLGAASVWGAAGGSVIQLGPQRAGGLQVRRGRGDSGDVGDVGPQVGSCAGFLRAAPQRRLPCGPRSSCMSLPGSSRVQGYGETEGWGPEDLMTRMRAGLVPLSVSPCGPRAASCHAQVTVGTQEGPWHQCERVWGGGLQLVLACFQQGVQKTPHQPG